MTGPSTNVFNLIRVQVPGATDPLVKLTLFEAVGDFCRWPLEADPPLDQSSDVATWLTDEQWAEHSTALMSATLVRLFAMPDKPWTNAEAAKAHSEVYAALVPRSREVSHAKAETPTYFDRMMANLTSAIPGMRAPYLQQEVFNTIDDLARNSLNLTPPDTNADPETWLTEPQWALYYRLVYAQAMARCLNQSGKPWYDPKGAQFYAAEAGALTDYARSDAGQGQNAVADPSARVMSSLLSRLPGAKESQIHIALFDTLQDACDRGRIWTEIVPFRLLPDRPVFSIAQPGARITRVLAYRHVEIDPSYIDYSNERISISADISKVKPTDPLYVTMALAPSLSVDMAAPQTWLPADLYASKYTLLLHGVLGTMMLQTAKPYSNRDLGQYHTQIYCRELNASPLTDRDGGVPTRQHWRFPRFA